ncbi:MAG: hypothetical protein IPM82_29765 [Saprospiraceae bacterium]|nr:hypothetical protein [Saprospiraceae bacterium]
MAEKAFTDAIHYYNKVNIPKTEIATGEAYKLLGNLMLEQNRIKEAKNYYKKALHILIPMLGAGHPTVAKIQLSLAKLGISIDKKLVNVEGVIELLLKGDEIDSLEDLSKLTGLRAPVLMEALSMKAAILSQKGNYEKSLNTYEIAYKVAEKCIQNIGLESSRQVFRENITPLFAGAMEASWMSYKNSENTGFTSRGFEMSEKSKLFLLLEGLNEERAIEFGGIPKEIQKQEQSLRSDIAFYEKAIFEEKQKKGKANLDNITKWQALLNDFNRTNDSLLMIIEKDYPDYNRLKYESLTTAPKAIQNQLSANTTLLEYFLTDTLLYTFAIVKKQVRFLRQPIDSTFFKNIQTFRRLVHEYDPTKRRTDGKKRADFQQFTQTSRALYKTLLEPALVIPEGNLIIIPDGAIGYLSFQALLTQDVDNEAINCRNLPYAVGDFNIRYEYSATPADGGLEQIFLPGRLSRRRTELHRRADCHAGRSGQPAVFGCLRQCAGRHPGADVQQERSGCLRQNLQRYLPDRSCRYGSGFHPKSKNYASSTSPCTP